jgi:uncharacterized protein (DUF1919 family)
MLKNQNFSIISNDCWAGEVYQHFNLAYNTPFVGLFLMAPCFVSLCEDLDVLNDEIRFISKSKYDERNERRTQTKNFYPIGEIGDGIEIQFLHFNSEQEAVEKWNRRMTRLNRDNLFIKLDGSKDGATVELIDRFDRLPFANKVCLLVDDKHSNLSTVKCEGWVKDGAKMFGISSKHFSITNWLNGNGLRPPSFLEKMVQKG